MEVLPIFSRELRVQARRGSTYWTRVATSIVALLFVVAILIESGGASGVLNQGPALFRMVANLSFIYCFFVGAFLAADSISFEKREGTLGLLFLTDLKGTDVVLGKLGSTSLNGAFGTLALLPILTIAILCGGVTLLQIAGMAVILASTLFWSLAVGVFISSISENERKALFGSFITLLLLASVPFALCSILISANWINQASLTFTVLAGFSPVFAFNIATTAFIFGPPNPNRLPISLMEINALSLVLLAAAAAMTSRSTRDRPVGQIEQKWRERWRRLLFGTPSQRLSLRQSLLDRNPCLWLSSREWLKPFSVWAALMPLGLLGWIVIVRYPAVAWETGTMLGEVLHIIFKVWLVSEICQRWVLDRRSGAFELILSTPLSGAEMIRGQGLALRRQFFWPSLGLVLLTLLFWSCRSFAPFEARKWILISIPIFVADCLALRWVAAWRGLNARGVDRALLASLATLFGGRWLILGLVNGFLIFWNWLQIGSIPKFIFGPLPWLGVTLVMDLILGWSARRKFLRFFRDIRINPRDWQQDAVTPPLPQNAPASITTNKEFTFRIGWRALQRRWWARVLITLFITGLGYAHYLRNLHSEVERQLQHLRGISVAEAVATGRIDHFSKVAAARTLSTASHEPVLDLLGAALIANQQKTGQLPDLLFFEIQKLQSIHQIAGPPAPGLGLASSPPPLASDLREKLTGLVSSNQTILDYIAHRTQHSVRPGAFPNQPPGLVPQNSFFTVYLPCLLLRFDALTRIDKGDRTGADQVLQILLDLDDSLSRAGIFGFRLQTSENVYSVFQWILSTPKHSIPLKFPVSDVADLNDGDGKPSSIALAELENIEAKLKAIKTEDWSDFLFYFAAMTQSTYDTASPALLSAMQSMPPSERSRIWIRTRIARLTGEQDREYSAFLRTIGRLIEIRNIPFPERSQLAHKIINEVQLRRYSNPNDPSRPHLFDGLRNFVDKTIELEARHSAALACIAVEKFRLLHSGQVPTSIAELVPVILETTFIDPFNGHTLRYQILKSSNTIDATAIGYRIYSIGANGRDDLGIEADYNPMPGTAAGDDVGITIFH
jgi:ABC-type transport system involved in multi-copper enzyme maturation permease subunit